jgi:hypothetical protein
MIDGMFLVIVGQIALYLEQNFVKGLLGVAKNAIKLRMECRRQGLLLFGWA